MNGKILGYDLRVIDPRELQTWDKARRSQYLLKPEVSWVASVDDVVFPSLFEYGAPAERTAATGKIAIEPSDMHQTALRLWADASAMEKAAKSESRLEDKNIIPIAITIIGDEINKLGYKWQGTLEESTNPATLDGTWQLMGYDVADGSLISGLSNCGYSEADKKALSDTWSQKINGFGLIGNLDDALKFKLVSEKRVPEHMPFIVFGVYRKQSG